ncbi:hypothetical protein H1235_04470 [Pseudoxanthomonas sp. NC8]|nr:hypothetical protein H1235_04470 [Pseudoxanthomonas sp. NC8]
MVGFQGQLTDTISVDFGARRTNYEYDENGYGYVIATLANQAIDAGDYLLTDPYGAEAGGGQRLLRHHRPQLLLQVEGVLRQRQLRPVRNGWRHLQRRCRRRVPRRPVGTSTTRCRRRAWSWARRVARRAARAT